MTESAGIDLAPKRELPIDDLCDENGIVFISLMMQADGITIIEVACKSVYLINVGLTGEAEYAHNCQSKKGLDSHARSDDIQVTDTLVVDDAADGLGKGVSHG